MFSREIVDTDTFLDMPCTTRLLYYDLGMRADDDGFLQDVQKIIRFTGASKNDLNILVAKGYVIPFDSGIVVIRHWRMHNQLRADRHKATVCINEMSTLTIGENGIYKRLTDGCQVVAKRLPGWQPSGNPVEDSIEEGSRGELFAATTTDLSDQSEAIPNVDDIIQYYMLPDGDATRQALLEDAKRVGFNALEEALKEAAHSNSREKISVKFYRAILYRPSETRQAKEFDPYAGVPVYGNSQAY